MSIGSTLEKSGADGQKIIGGRARAAPPDRGFRRRTSHWHRDTEGALQVMNLQKSQYCLQFYVKLCCVPDGMEAEVEAQRFGLPSDVEARRIISSSARVSPGRRRPRDATLLPALPRGGAPIRVGAGFAVYREQPMDQKASDAVLAVHYSGKDERFFLPMKIGDVPQDADEGAALILDGIKTTTSSGHWHYPDGRIPFVGALSLLLDGRDTPLAIVETTEVWIAPFASIDAAFARDYGEGERSLAWWFDTVGRWYRADAELHKVVFTEQTPIICERFRVLKRL